MQVTVSLYDMYLVAIAWIYVAAMMAAAEATSPNGTVLGAVFTFLLYGVMPLAVVLYVMATPQRRRMRRAREADEAAQAAAGSSATEPPGAANSTGRQSATCAVHAMPVSVVMLASVSCTGASGAASAAVRRTTRAPCTWFRYTGVAPIASASRRWLLRTAAGSSPMPSRMFMLSYGAALKPPRRAVITPPAPPV